MKIGLLLCFFAVFMGCSLNPGIISDSNKVTSTMEKKLEKAYLAGGCFWCTEAVFQQLDGVESVVSGYMGGHIPNPTYEQICNGDTGHAEAVEITYDPEVVDFGTLLEIFFATHNPTTLNRQGNDIGTQYRSAIFYTNDQQKDRAEAYIKLLNDSHTYGIGKVVVTQVEAMVPFYCAEAYHQNYYQQNPLQPYCYYVITPKMEKLAKQFEHRLKKK